MENGEGKIGREVAQNKITTAPACLSIHNEFLTQRRRDAEAQRIVFRCWNKMAIDEKVSFTRDILITIEKTDALGSGGKILVYCTPSSRSSPPKEKKEQTDSADQAHDPVSSGWFPMFEGREMLAAKSAK